MAGRYKQFIKHMMRTKQSNTTKQSDTAKLKDIAIHLQQKFKCVILREPILRFHREDCRLLGIYENGISESQYKSALINCPDLVSYIGPKMHIWEIDGFIHSNSSIVKIKDLERERRYQASKINYHIISEEKVLWNLGRDINRSATAEELIPVIDEKVLKIIGTDGVRASRTLE